MPFDQAFALSSVLLATMAFSGLVLAQSVPFWLALPMVIILMISALHVGGSISFDGQSRGSPFRQPCGISC